MKKTRRARAAVPRETEPIDLSAHATEEEREKLRDSIYALFELGEFASCLDMLEILNAFGALTLEMALLQTMCMYEVGKRRAAVAMFRKIEANVQEALRKRNFRSKKLKSVLLRTLETTRRCLKLEDDAPALPPGGKRRP